jgi:hypothetical protein
MIYRREGMRHQCWSLVIVSTERGRQVGDEVLHHGLPRSRESPVYRRGHGESVFACASTLVRRGEYRAQTGIWRLLSFVSVRTIKGRSIGVGCLSYLVNMTRPDLAFTYSQLSKFVQSPGPVHLAAAERALAYLRGTYNEGITYCDPGEDRRNKLTGWVDSDFAARHA